MSVDEIRRKAQEAGAIPEADARFTPDAEVRLRPAEAEALCDLADVVRDHVDRQCEHCPHEHPMQEAMARVDGDHELARWLRGETDAPDGH